jgi:hypothetical protein
MRSRGARAFIICICIVIVLFFLIRDRRLTDKDVVGLYSSGPEYQIEVEIQPDHTFRKYSASTEGRKVIEEGKWALSRDFGENKIELDSKDFAGEYLMGVNPLCIKNAGPDADARDPNNWCKVIHE